MSSVTQPVTSWDEFLLLPERPENAKRYELHDGEVVIVPPPRPWHLKRQKRIERLLEPLAGERGVIALEFPYRPAPNLQYWVADLAFVPQVDWDTMPLEQWQVYAPPLIIEILSPSNTAVKANRQRMTAMSAGTQAFWIVDEKKQTIEVSCVDRVTVYGLGETVPLPMFDAELKVDEIFA